jgi:flagellar basal body-associated protein FliL
MKEKDKDKDQEEGQETSKASIKAWLPLIAALVIMPATAWAVTHFVLVKNIKETIAAATGNPVGASQTSLTNTTAPAIEEPEKKKGDESSGKEDEDSDPKVNPLSTIYENIDITVKGTKGTRHLFFSFEVQAKNENAQKIIVIEKYRIQEKAVDLISNLSMEEIYDQPVQSKKKVIKMMETTLNKEIKDSPVDSIIFYKWSPHF